MVNKRLVNKFNKLFRIVAKHYHIDLQDYIITYTFHNNFKRKELLYINILNLVSSNDKGLYFSNRIYSKNVVKVITPELEEFFITKGMPELIPFYKFIEYALSGNNSEIILNNIIFDINKVIKGIRNESSDNK